MSDEVAQGREPAGGRERAGPPGPFAPGGRHRRTLVMAAVVLAFLVVIAVIGIFRDPATPKPRPTSTPSPSASGAAAAPPLQLTSTRCATLQGSALTVGFGVVNRGPAPLTVAGLNPSFPIGGLTVDETGVPALASCPAPPARVPTTLAPGASAVLALVLKASDPRCVGPLVVDVEVLYDVAGSTETIGGNQHVFPDLGGFGLPETCGSPTA